MKFKLDKDKKLFWMKDEKWTSVELKACFPKSMPNSHFSLQNSSGEELAFIEDFSKLMEEERKLVEEYFRFKHFVFTIEGIYNIEEDFGLRNFNVKTEKGDRTFQMKLEEWPKICEDGRIEFTDIFGECYQVVKLEFGDKLLASYV